MTPSTSTAGLFAGISWALALGWLYQLVDWLLNFHRVPDLIQTPPPPLPQSLADSPQLTVIVPACNEESSIAATLRSLLASVEISVQIIAVNDRSTDSTGDRMQAVLDEISAASPGQYPRNTLEILHIDQLPEGWLGKPHALHRAAQSAKADWLLFTDGDVLFHPHALSLALRYAVAQQADHLVLMPEWLTRSPGEAAMHGAMHALSTWTLRFWRIPDPRAKDFLGVGAFNLVRRSTYDAIGGFEVLCMEVLEDLRLGWTIKRAGYRQRIALGPGLAAVRWAHGAWGVVRNLEKNLFALYRYNTPLAALASAGLFFQIAWPLAGLWLGGWARGAALVQYAAIAGIYIASRHVTRVRPIYVFMYPLAAGIFLFAHIRSVGLALARGGIIWRGTVYPLRALRAQAGRFW